MGVQKRGRPQTCRVTRKLSRSDTELVSKGQQEVAGEELEKEHCSKDCTVDTDYLLRWWPWPSLPFHPVLSPPFLQPKYQGLSPAGHISQALPIPKIQNRDKEGWELNQGENGPRAITAGKQPISIIGFLLGLFSGSQWQEIERQMGGRSWGLSSLPWSVSLAQPSPTVAPASTEQTHFWFQCLRVDPSKLTLPPPLLPPAKWWRLLAVANLWWLPWPLSGSSLFHNLCLQFPAVIILCVTKVPLS